MEEKDEQVVEETTKESTEQVDESKFESAGDDSVTKVDLSKPPTNETEESNTNDTGVAGSDEDAEPNLEKFQLFLASQKYSPLPKLKVDDVISVHLDRHGIGLQELK